MRVWVTGASGFIGSAVIRELVENGHQASGLVRSAEAAERLEASGARAVRGSIEQTDLLRKEAGEADAVVHTAFYHKFSHAGLSAKLRIMLGGSPARIPARFMQTAIETDRRAIEAMGTALSRRSGALTIAMPTMTLSPGLLATEDAAGDVSSVGGGRVVSEKTLLALADRGVRASLVRLPPIVYGAGDSGGLLPSLIAIAKKKGTAAYVGEGLNRWSSVHRLDAARLFRMAVEQAEAGTKLHAAAEEGMAFKEIAENISRHANLPLKRLESAEADAYFGWLSAFAAADNPVSSALTRQRLGWEPTERDLRQEMERGHYFSK
ncbi:3-beta hydroxysteroid dehydrogenase [Saccharibacillus sp. O23]|uniref:SDR family oxidoreductase n=1 Tax=Saccharibacillus sp. O23 TaxID=2009338 RepID=UPI000B4E2F0B|nr:SDR family oxidoreductase [Saccharibacillus sp. O23]OWR32998.1 3-beta hydroxysteroid dehydrogenase [Saccharibacillus sp. O23]